MPLDECHEEKKILQSRLSKNKLITVSVNVKQICQSEQGLSGNMVYHYNICSYHEDSVVLSSFCPDNNPTCIL